MGDCDTEDPSRCVPVLWMSRGEDGRGVTQGFLTVLVLGIGCQVGISFGLTTLEKFCEYSLVKSD